MSAPEILDSENANIGPLIVEIAARYAIDPVLLLGMLLAESELYTKAERWGSRTNEARALIIQQDWERLQALIDDVWQDVSFGLSQMTVRTARGYGIGSGSSSVANCMYVRGELWNPAQSIEVGAKHLAGSCIAGSMTYFDPALQALIKYNSGSFQPEGNWYWTDPRWRQNIDRYKACLERAKAMLHANGQLARLHYG